MKRQSIFLILLLLQVFMICAGCGSSEKAAATEGLAAAIPEAVTALEEDAVDEVSAPAEEASLEADLTDSDVVENAIGIFEGLEDNHTAIFSFDGAETAFFFADSAVQSVLYEAVSGSSYTLSYSYDDAKGPVIYQISEH